MDSKRVREIPNEHSAIYFKEIPAQLAEIKESLLRVTGSGLPGMTYKTLRDEIAIAAMQGDMGNNNGMWANNPDKVAIERYYQIADAMLEARESSSMASQTPTSNS